MSGLRIFAEIIVAFLAAGGLLFLCWALFGRLLAPVAGEEVWAVVRAGGAGERLEHDVAGLLWLRVGGMARFTIVIVDDGLDERGRAVAEALLSREPAIRLCAAGTLESCMGEG